MSKAEGEKLFQPIPLSAIIDPTYQTPYSKVKQFQVTMDAPCTHQHHHGGIPTVWGKLQSTLMRAMSNLVIMSHPVFSTTMVNRTASTMSSLLPMRSWNASCDVSSLTNNNGETDFPKSSSVPQKTQLPESLSFYHSIRSGLQCLRYLATHPVNCEKAKANSWNTAAEENQNHCKLTNISAPPSLLLGGIDSFMGRVIFFPIQLSVSDSFNNATALSAPTTPSHGNYQDRPNREFPIPNIFFLAMRGLLNSCPQQYLQQINSLYKNFGFFPLIIKGSGSGGQTGSLSAPPSPQKTVNIDFATLGSNIEIFIRSATASSQEDHGEATSPKLAKSSGSEENSVNTSGSGGGCIKFETNWGKNKKNQDDNATSSYHHSVSMCSSSSSTINGSTFAFSCSSTISSSPKAMASSCFSARRRKESESSTDSFVEFSASVESADSFCIVFEPAGDSIDEEDINRADESEEDWEDDENEEEDSDEEEDLIFNYSSSTTNDLFEDCDQVDFGFQPQLMKKSSSKQVSFNEDHLAVVIEFEDDSASQSARETYWEMLARDRSRFQDRIFRVGEILEPILQPDHRSKVLQQRLRQINE